MWQKPLPQVQLLFSCYSGLIPCRSYHFTKLTDPNVMSKCPICYNFVPWSIDHNRNGPQQMCAYSTDKPPPSKNQSRLVSISMLIRASHLHHRMCLVHAKRRSHVYMDWKSQSTQITELSLLLCKKNLSLLMYNRILAFMSIPILCSLHHLEMSVLDSSAISLGFGPTPASIMRTAALIA